MTTIQYANGENQVANPAGFHLKGTGAMGLEDGLNPKELMEAALGLCVSLTLTRLLERDGLLDAATQLAIEVTSVKDEGGQNRIGHFDIGVQFPQGLDDAYIEKAMVIVERGCTIGNTIRQSATTEMRRL